ncbi:MAG: hypothetical protein FWJ62_00945 [Thermaerobacter sp.]|nr:hypothetical protein [Bacillota bacterium]
MLWTDVLILGLLAAAAGIWAYWRRARPSARPARRGIEGSRRHQQAAALLEELGYTAWDQVPAVTLTTRVDGRAHTTEIQADLLASQGGRTYVVHLSGGETRRVTTRAGRRGLLEYVIAYRPDGILLVDLDRRRVRRVEFTVGGVAARRAADGLRWLGAAGAGAAAAYVLFRWMG